MRLTETKNGSARTVPLSQSALEVMRAALAHPVRPLRRGEVGTVVELYEPDGLEAEFVTGTGRARATVHLAEKRGSTGRPHRDPERAELDGASGARSV